jgi:multiple sugar transport system substrate-binding protein
MARTLSCRLGALLAVGVLTAAGCGGSGEDGERVRFLVFGDPEELAAYRELIDAYGQREPEAEIQLVEASDRQDLLARLSTSFAAGDPFDVFLINYRFYGQFAAKGVLEPLEGRVESSDAFSLADFYPQPVAAFRWRGDVTCLPQNVSSLVVYYNRDLFRRHDLPEPRAGWTYQDMVERATQLTLDAKGAPVQAVDPTSGAAGPRPAVFGLGVEPSIIRLAPFVWSAGAELVDDERRPTRFVLERPAGLAALQQFLDLRSRYLVTPTDQDREAEDDESRFANGRLAMLLSSRRSTPTFRTIDEFDWDVAPLPVLAEAAGILHSDAYCMAAASSRKDAAWSFIEFALGEEGQRVVARTGRTVPSLISVSRSRAFLDPTAKPKNAQVFLDGIPAIRRVPSISTWPEIEDAVGPILERGFELGVPAAEVAGQIDEATRPLFARAEHP